MKAKLDFLEANGFGAVEIPSDNRPIKNCDAMVEAMKARKLFLATACGPSDFSHAEQEKREDEVRKFLPIIEALGKMKSVGLILCPARPENPPLPVQASGTTRWTIVRSGQTLFPLHTSRRQI